MKRDIKVKLLDALLETDGIEITHFIKAASRNIRNQKALAVLIRRQPNIRVKEDYNDALRAQDKLKRMIRDDTDYCLETSESLAKKFDCLKFKRK